jgi:hypothetical protein
VASRSTRISIVEKSLQDIFERIMELPHPAAQELHQKARQVAFAVARWATTPPSREEREKALNDVLALNVEVMAASRRARGA